MCRYGLFMGGLQEVLYVLFQNQMCKAGTTFYVYNKCGRRGRVDRACERLAKDPGSTPCADSKRQTFRKF